ncbi:MAG: response regulator [Desulfarculaceae bacterium]|nr:response regulator [Desulfarculaceae bacterium]
MKNETILIIDDDIYIRDSLAAYLEDIGYRTLQSDNGKSGIDLFLKQQPSLVITDLRMPEKDGIDVLKIINEKSPDTPKIVISGAGNTEDVIEALRAGAKDYITKPIEDFSLVTHTIGRNLENARLIRENREYKKHLIKSEKLYRTIAESVGEGIVSTDEHMAIHYANSAFFTMTGFAEQDLLKKTLADLCAPESAAELENLSCEDGRKKNLRFEIKLATVTGKPIDVQVICSPIFNKSEQYKGTVSIIRDIRDIIFLREQYEKVKGRPEKESKNLVPICAGCKSIRNKDGVWVGPEEYFSQEKFTHGFCDDCMERLYPDHND